MKILLESLSLIFSRSDSRRVLFLATVTFLLLVLAFQNGTSAVNILSFDALPFGKRVALFLSTFFDVTSTFTPAAGILALFGSIVGGLNLTLAYTYIRLRGEAVVHSGLYSGLGLFLAFLGIGCAACGTALLSTLLGVFGAGAALSILPYQGLEIGYIGIAVLFIATYFLAKKVNTPYVC